MIDLGLKDKVVLITGANNPYGIGAATAKAFAAQGARVFHFFRLPQAPGGAEPARGPRPTFYQAQQGKTADDVLDAIPLRRVGQREDVADVIVFLASEQARWITAQLICVGGGNAMLL